MQGTESKQINYPEWTEYQKKNGLDPLGMQNSSINLYQLLLPGISNVTLRMRYYGLYAWLNRTYARNIGDTNPEIWKRYIRLTEALYALVACRHSGETGVAGIDWAQRKLNTATGEIIEFSQDAIPGSDTHYLKQAWGAYGAAYGSQLVEIGILTTVGHSIPVLTEEIGEPLAEVFDEAMGKLAHPFFEVIKRGSVTISELDDFAGLAPSQIDPTTQERERYQDLLLKALATDDVAAQSRRLSILLILKVAALLRREPKPDEIRWILYAGYNIEGHALDLTSPDLEAHRQRWWIYHANDLSHIAMETLLKFALDQLGQFPAGITLEHLIGRCVDEIQDVAEDWPENLEEFLEGLSLAKNAYATNNPESEWSLSRDIVRGAGRSDAKSCSPELAWKAVKLLAIEYQRCQESSRDITAELGHFNSEAFRSLLSETRYLASRLKEPFADLVGSIIEERVIRRHMWVALRKFRYQRDYTFLIEMDEGRIRLREKDGPAFTNPRLGPAITFLKDIHLLNSQGLTELGLEAAGAA